MIQFVEKAEEKAIKNIDNYYREIDTLYFEIETLQDSLWRYQHKKAGYNQTGIAKVKQMANIRGRILQVYDNINYYKECINAEKKDIDRIYKTYLDNYEPYDLELEAIENYYYNYATGQFLSEPLIKLS